MDSISRYLAKFHTLTPPVKTIKRVCCDVVQKDIGFRLEQGGVEVKGKVVYIQGNPALKQEIFMRKNTLCERINEELSVHGFSITDIR